VLLNAPVAVEGGDVGMGRLGVRTSRPSPEVDTTDGADLACGTAVVMAAKEKAGHLGAGAGAEPQRALDEIVRGVDEVLDRDEPRRSPAGRRAGVPGL